ncbi:MAG: cysteine synthase A, partial [candidate division Zixibacteria bacterium]|nr:cysteine synthase A [candidate division Zixibacteria bacterium]
SAGANVSAGLKVAGELGAGHCVVTILCDTGERYLSLREYYEGSSE